MVSRGKSLKNNAVHLIISVTLIQVMRSQKVSVYESVNEHTNLDNSEKNMSPERIFLITYHYEFFNKLSILEAIEIWDLVWLADGSIP
ncbi:hypothetical protein BpHYR1_003693 [Brachionus plicatilis]|uniref:Uncharacterized protein n=1 Tax=Brachionus plicatilis TaxID=10195 RepID=A0A3M7QW76_BRAPC|nr:hypothetical protein BpHYR1_003693 [Brachionus plicatilis]